MSSQTITFEDEDELYLLALLDTLPEEGTSSNAAQPTTSNDSGDSNEFDDKDDSVKTQKLPYVDSDDEDDSFTCTICQDQWHSSGSHRAVSIKCGHLFGRHCIERWFQEKRKRSLTSRGTCPICSSSAEEKDIRPVIPAKIAFRDTTQSRELSKELDSLKMEIKSLESDIELSEMSLNLYKREFQRAKERRRLTHTKATDEVSVGNVGDLEDDGKFEEEEEFSVPVIPQKRIIEQFSVCTSYRVSPQRNVCCAMALDTSTNSAYVSVKLSPTTHNIVKIDIRRQGTTDLLSAETTTVCRTTANMTSSIPNIHDSQISALQFSNNSILSTSTDKTLKLTSAITKQAEVTMLLPQPGRTCQFDPVDLTKVYCGLSNSQILIFDVRMSNQPLDILKDANISTSLLHSMLIRSYGEGKKDIYCSNLSETFVWRSDVGAHRCYAIDTKLNIAGFKPYSLTFHSTVQQNQQSDEETLLLLSSRHPQNAMKHQLIRINPQSLETVRQPSILLTYDMPLQQRSLRKTCSFSHNKESMADNSIICYGDEVAGRLCFSRTAKEFHSLRLQSCPNDIQLYDAEARVAFITDNRFFLSQPHIKQEA